MSAPEPIRSSSADRLPAELEPRFLSAAELLEDLDREVVFREGRLLGPGALKVQPIDPARRRIALAVNGGGAKGAYSAGLLEGLLERLRGRGLRPDLIVGTSAGALNSYGVFIEALGMANPQLKDDPELKQPYSTFIAAMWSYLDRFSRTSGWIVGGRSWMVDLATRGLHTPARRWSLYAVLALAIVVLNPFLFAGFFFLLGLDSLLPSFFRPDAVGSATPLLAALGALSLAGLALTVWTFLRMFGQSLFHDTPMIRLLANTGPNGDLSRQDFSRPMQARDQARALSRDLVRAWYERRDELPELIITTVDITVGRECLFTLVRPDTYRRLVKNGWMTVQLDSEGDAAQPYHEIPGALFVDASRLIETIVASAAVPSAFPAQPMRIYNSGGERSAMHRFLDGGVLNNSPLHLAIDAEASHIISLELDPMKTVDPLELDDQGVTSNVLEAGVTTFEALLDRATERDIRRTVTWNRFLAQNPEAALAPRSRRRPDDDHRERKRIVPIYRLAPAEKLLDTAHFDGRYENGRLVASVRDTVQAGARDLKGKRIWRATMQPEPSSSAEAK